MSTMNWTPRHLTTPELAESEHIEAALQQALRPALATLNEHLAGLVAYAPFDQVDALDIHIDDMLRAAYTAGLKAGGLRR